MEISEDEARRIYYALVCSNEEQGVIDETDPIMKRIRAEFPLFDAEIKKKEHRDHLWCIVIEEDPRVIAERERTKFGVTDPSECHKLYEIKRLVMKEILEQEKTNVSNNTQK